LNELYDVEGAIAQLLHSKSIYHYTFWAAW